MWLTGDGLRHNHDLRVGCFAINLLTVVRDFIKTLFDKHTYKFITFTTCHSIQTLQCVAMNVTLIYALLAYSSIKQRDFSGVYVGHFHAHNYDTFIILCPRRCSRDLCLFMCGPLSALSLPTSLPGLFHSCLS